MGKPKKSHAPEAEPDAEGEAAGGESQVVQPISGSSHPAEPEAPAPWLLWLSAKFQADRAAELAVWVLGALLLLPALGSVGLWDPWETHYGEVAREMIARNDYVYPHWESAYFFSKPALTLWLMALGMFVFRVESAPSGEPLGSMVEWAVRLPFALLALWAIWAAYRIGKQLRDRNTGLIAAFVLATCPQFIFIGKQAMTDMPLVALLTVGLAFFMAAVFDEEEDAAPSQNLKILTAVGLFVAVFPQLFLIGRELKGLGLAGVAVAGMLGAAAIAFVVFRASRRDCYLISFYALAGLAALAKGLAILAVVGPVVVLYCLFSGDWRLLLRSKFYVYGLVFLLVATPWYLTLSLFGGRDDEGLTFTQRFWQHDNFNRVGSGVHGDRGGLGYYTEQLAYGMFPWAAMIPFAVGHAIRRSQDVESPVRARATLFVLIWGLWVFTFFTMSQTKFHHYIFPAVPAFAILVALWVRWLADAPKKRLSLVLSVVILLLLSIIGRDLLNDPKHLVNLFTYKYDRTYPREVHARLFLGVIMGIGAAALLVSYLRKRMDQALLGYGLLAGLFAAWISHHHFNMLSPHWSQYHLFDTFYEEKQPGEPIYAYQLNWRGETFYSRNTILQVKESGANQRIKRLVEQPGREFIITEQSRYQTLKSALGEYGDKMRILDRSNNKFYLIVVEE